MRTLSVKMGRMVNKCTRNINNVRITFQKFRVLVFENTINNNSSCIVIIIMIKMSNKRRTIKSLVHKIRLRGRRGKGMAECFSREKLRHAPQKGGG